MIKKITAFVLFVALTFSANAQLETPQPSPRTKIEQTVGLTKVTLDYSRPGVKGRTIFGDLVPFGKTWRTGANMNSTITFEHDVTIDGKSLKAGTYAIYTVPNQNSWDVMFYTDTNNWGNPQKWETSKVALKTTVGANGSAPMTETFSININSLKNDSAHLDIAWENTHVAIPFSVPTEKIAEDNISKIMAGPSVTDYFEAAKYYYDNGKDLNKAKQWIETAVALRKEPAFWQIRLQSLIYAKLGDKQEAIKAAQRSLDLAKKANYEPYIKMNEASIKEWSE